ncbi:MAG: type IV-A pilus assembly ATPase PilB, partial [Halomonas sp.]
MLSHQEAINAETSAIHQDVSILHHVIDSGLVTPREAATAAGWEYGLPVIDLDAVRISSLPPV